MNCLLQVHDLLTTNINTATELPLYRGYFFDTCKITEEHNPKIRPSTIYI